MKSPHIPVRARRAVAAGTSVYERGSLWIENQPPDSRKGATIGWVRRYQAADGQLYRGAAERVPPPDALPVFLVTASYAYKDPTALADRIEHRLRLQGTTAASVLVGDGRRRASTSSPPS